MIRAHTDTNKQVLSHMYTLRNGANAIEIRMESKTAAFN